MRALGASERVMSIISSAEVTTAADKTAPVNMEIAGGAKLGDTVAGKVVFKVSTRASIFVHIENVPPPPSRGGERRGVTHLPCGRSRFVNHAF